MHVSASARKPCGHGHLGPLDSTVHMHSHGSTMFFQRFHAVHGGLESVSLTFLIVHSPSAWTVHDPMALEQAGHD